MGVNMKFEWRGEVEGKWGNEFFVVGYWIKLLFFGIVFY